MNGWKTLVVDDEPEVASHLNNQLAQRGLKVEVAHTTNEAQFLIEKNEYDLAILDIMLPDGNGIDLFRILQEENPDIYTIMITGHASVENAIFALNEGINGYLIKPFSDSQLSAVLNKAEKTLRLKAENKALFQQIELNKQFYEDVLNSTSEAILVVDLDYKIQYSNRAAAELLNLEEIPPAKPPLETYILDGYKILSHIYQQLLQGKSVAGYRVSISPDGSSSFDAHLTADFLYGKNEHVEGLIINLSNPLIHNEVLNRILRKEKLNTINRLAHVLNHEIRNPINILFGRLQLLKDEFKNAKFDQAFPGIQKQIDRIVTVTDLLSKFNLSREDTIPEQCAISEIFDDILSEKKPEFAAKNIQLNYSLERNGFYVEGNLIQFSDAFRYLLDTIIEISSENAVLDVQGKETGHYSSSRWYEFQFILPTEQSDIHQFFEPYKSIDMEIDGLIGLGMAIMHTIFNNYGAKIETSFQNTSKTLLKIRFPLFDQDQKRPFKPSREIKSKKRKRRSA
ncbi:MAG: response regulator [Calditrichaeota bacterium]|nr:response regulator [Calditrichota bacterium]